MNWWKNRVIYQIYPLSFADTTGSGRGDIRGIIEKLPYLAELGVGAVWICPMFLSPRYDNGYDVSDYKTIDPDFGTNEDMYELISAAHALDIKVIMDLVVNHTASSHEWFQRSRRREKPYDDFYYWRKGRADGGPPSNWGSNFGGSAWTFDSVRGEYYFHNFAAEQPDLNWNVPEVIDRVCDVINFWQDKGVDGWRVDAIPYIDKDPDFTDYDPADFPEGTEYFVGERHYKNGNFPKFIREINRRAWSKRADCMTVAELGGLFTTDDLLDMTADGGAFSMCFTFDHITCDYGDKPQNGKWDHGLLDTVRFTERLSYWQELNARGGNTALFLNNHDQPRFLNVLCADCEDEGAYVLAAKTLAIMLHMLGGTPFVYQGEELGMTNCPFDKDEYRDIEFYNGFREYVDTGKMSREDFLAEAAYRCRDNARTPMQWNDGENAGFTSGSPWIKVNPNYKRINAAAQIDDPDSVYACYKRLIALRRECGVISMGSFTRLDNGDGDVFIYERAYNGRRIVVCCNLRPREVKATLPRYVLRGEVAVSSYRDSVPRENMLLRPFETFAVMCK